MKNIIFTLFIVLFFLGCSSSSLNLDGSGNLDLRYDDNTYLIGDKAEYDRLLNFKDLFVKQYILKDSDNSVLFYEELQTDMNYEFNFDGFSTVMCIFDDSKKYEEVYTRGNIRLVQIQLKDKKYVNVLVQDNSVQFYSFIYGFSNEEFLKIANKIKVDDKEIIKPKFEVVTFDLSSKPLTSWDDLVVFFTPLITPLRELRSF